MYLENLVFDAVDPQGLGRFWEAALGSQVLTDDPDVYETRLSVLGGPDLDLCFQRVSERPNDDLRLHLDLLGGLEQTSVVDRLLGLGARHLDLGQQNVPWVVLSDPEGNPFCVMEERLIYAGTGPIAAVPIDSRDPAADADFWRWLTGWVAAPGGATRSLRHPSQQGLLLEFCPEPEPKAGAKNRLHLDVRLESADDPESLLAEVSERGGRELDPGWGELPWRVCADPSGNEFCLLPARAT
ncbi:MAG: VOC family protein [Humibacillus sp.]|nr:VOC family protein [Humibacillus sp.]MDN5779287.1 VOC family protein [Humibacillus sp.]